MANPKNSLQPGKKPPWNLRSAMRRQASPAPSKCSNSISKPRATRSNRPAKIRANCFPSAIRKNWRSYAPKLPKQTCNSPQAMPRIFTKSSAKLRRY